MHHACLAQVMTLAKEDQAAFFTLVATSIADMIAPATARARGTGTPLPIWRATGYGRPANVQQSGTPCRRAPSRNDRVRFRSEEHTSELQSLMRNSYAGFCLKNKHNTKLYIRTELSNI